jgi:hypothetical protein
MAKTLELFPLKDFRKNVVMRTYQFVVTREVDFNEEAWELIYVDAESLDVARTKAKEQAEAYGYTCEPEFVRVVQNKELNE